MKQYYENKIIDLIQNLTTEAVQFGSAMATGDTSKQTPSDQLTTRKIISILRNVEADIWGEASSILETQKADVYFENKSYKEKFERAAKEIHDKWLESAKEMTGYENNNL